MPHLAYTLLLAALISTAMAASENRPAQERRYRAAYLFVYSVGLVVAGSWAMLAIHG
jgi:hypothetical protein